MFAPFDWLKIGGGFALGAVLIYLPARYYGEKIGKDIAAIEALQKSVINLRDRNKIDEQISSSDAYSLCRDFGLPDEQVSECVRRLAEASASP